ncbi:MAG: hypothetical protein IJU48_07290 [Synergistaceae bacterium]|nr:hypothetical protein [Synergistaceae bacterium]
MNLNEAQRQSLITSLLGFVRRVSFHGADWPEEADAFSTIACLLLGCPVWWSTGEDVSVSDLCDETAELDELQKSENSGKVRCCECGSCRCFIREE